MRAEQGARGKPEGIYLKCKRLRVAAVQRRYATHMRFLLLGSLTDYLFGNRLEKNFMVCKPCLQLIMLLKFFPLPKSINFASWLSHQLPFRQPTSALPHNGQTAL